jgi:hypothetical protein
MISLQSYTYYIIQPLKPVLLKIVMVYMFLIAHVQKDVMMCNDV